MEPATLRYVRGIRRLAAEQDAAVTTACFRYGDNRHQSPGIRVQRRLDDLVGGADLHDPAEVDDRHPVR